MDEIIVADVSYIFDPELIEFVLKKSVFTPYKIQNPISFFVKDSGYCNRFPKKFIYEAEITKDSYKVTYRSRYH